METSAFRRIAPVKTWRSIRQFGLKTDLRRFLNQRLHRPDVSAVLPEKSIHLSIGIKVLTIGIKPGVTL